MITLLLLVAVSALEPLNAPKFIIDFDVPASHRYLELYHHFKEPLLEMENYWYKVMPQATRDFYARNDNLQKFKQANPDVYDAMESLANVLGVDVLQTVTVNAITEYSTYCTSIVARNADN
jgi:hypothetical protein